MPKGNRAILKADPEDGTTPVANLLLEALAAAPLSGVEKGAVSYLWRQTYGWQEGPVRKKQTIISNPEWAKALNTNEGYAARVIRGLVDKKVFLRTDLGKGKGYIYTTNTKVNEWIGGVLISTLLPNETPVLDSTPPPKKDSVPPHRKYSVLRAKQYTPPDTPPVSPKEILNKILKKGDFYILNNGEIIGGVGDFDSGEASKIWEEALGRLKEQVSRSNYRTWLERTTGVGCHDSRFIIGTPSDFVTEYLSGNQRSLVEKTLFEVAKRHYNIYFLVMKGEGPPPQENSP